MALFWRIWAAMTLVMLAVLAVFVGLATLQFGNINSDLVGERLAVLAGRTAGPFSAAAQIGLPLSTVRNADALLERARQTDDSILAIHVFDAAGQVVHSTASPAPSDIPREAAGARARANGAAWHRESANGFFSGTDITLHDGTSAGGILIVYPRSGSLIRLRAMAAELAVTALGILVASAVLSALLLRLGLRRQIRFFTEIDSAIIDFERAAWRGSAQLTGDAKDSATGELRQVLAAAEVRYIATRRAMATAEDSTP